MNPYKILDLGADATQKAIIQAVTRAMREKRHSGHQLAQAQKILLDPISGAAQRFLHTIDLSGVRQSMPPGDAFDLNREQIAHLTSLTLFDEDTCNRKKSS